MNRQQVVDEARRWIGTPYRHHARIRGVGVDCVQILCAVYQACGVWSADVEPGEYAHDWHLHGIDEKYLQQLAPHARPVDIPQAGDIAVFHFGHTYSHGGIVDTEGRIIHSYIRRGVIVSGLHEEPLDGVPVLFFDPFGGA